MRAGMWNYMPSSTTGSAILASAWENRQLLGGGLPQSTAQDLVCVPAGGTGQRGPAVVPVGAAQRLVPVSPGLGATAYTVVAPCGMVLDVISLLARRFRCDALHRLVLITPGCHRRELARISNPAVLDVVCQALGEQQIREIALPVTPPTTGIASLWCSAAPPSSPVKTGERPMKSEARRCTRPLEVVPYIPGIVKPVELTAKHAASTSSRSLENMLLLRVTTHFFGAFNLGALVSLPCSRVPQLLARLPFPS
eukprot:CAMPEP_0173334092 /NCGR_PEP_ID=MMETSP1144-20121109/5247_1 /TAXON_ID=483371 /ORGANISM="non described non described, Strain CCMP2298" /LENGTH=252 /DNA_ID=CAMNT_0014279111 /DNA_START=101 /DNA_END=856 /DNA_ORIENTATION=+